MNFLYFVGGLLVGFCGAISFFIIRLSKLQFDKQTYSVDNVIRRLRPRKGFVIEPKSDETVAMEDLFEANDRAGKETLIGEIESDEHLS